MNIHFIFNTLIIYFLINVKKKHFCKDNKDSSIFIKISMFRVYDRKIAIYSTLNLLSTEENFMSKFHNTYFFTHYDC